jgi:hypothetical protein
MYRCRSAVAASTGMIVAMRTWVRDVFVGLSFFQIVARGHQSVEKSRNVEQQDHQGLRSQPVQRLKRAGEPLHTAADVLPVDGGVAEQQTATRERLHAKLRDRAHVEVVCRGQLRGGLVVAAERQPADQVHAGFRGL